MTATAREWLLVQGPGSPAENYELTSAVVRVGRGRANDLRLGDDSVSSSHAEIVERRGRRVVRDLGSTNGTVLNGRPLARGAEVALRDGDQLQIGPYTLGYRLDPQSVAQDKRADPAVGGTDATLPPGAGSHRRRGALGVLLPAALTLVALAALMTVVIWLLAPPRLALLVLGSDARPDELRRGDLGRTDTLMTVIADRPPNGVAIISLPRDLWVEIPGYGEERINTAHALGGAQTAKRTVANVLGTPVDRYLLIGLQGVRDVVDAAGGIEIDVETAIYDDAYPTDDYGTVVLRIPAGRQSMNGETALRYARTRHQDNDFARTARQQQVLIALRTSLLRPTNWWRWPAVLNAVRQTVRTDLNPIETLALGLALVASPGDPARLAVGPGLVDPIAGADGAYLLRPLPALRQAVALLLAPREARVEVLNGTAVTGRAREAAEQLRGAGFLAVRYGDAAGSQALSSVETRPGGGRAGAVVASTLGLPAAVVRESGGLPANLDVRVVLGSS